VRSQAELGNEFLCAHRVRRMALWSLKHLPRSQADRLEGMIISPRRGRLSATRRTAACSNGDVTVPVEAPNPDRINLGRSRVAYFGAESLESRVIRRSGIPPPLDFTHGTP